MISPPRSRRALDWLLWQMLVDWSPEKMSGLCALCWGLWVLVFRFLATSPGWHFLVYLVGWQAWLSADTLWGAVAVGTGLRQLGFACRTFELPAARVSTAYLSGCVWAFFSVAILLSQPGNTGVVIYGWLAWNSFAAYHQLFVRARGRGLL